MKEIDFVAIDFEHAMSFKGSVCAVGIVSFKNGEIIDEYSTLIQPPNNEYNPFTMRVHGITPYDTENAPKFIDIYPEIKKRINGCTVVAHNAFGTDKPCLEQAMSSNGIEDVLKIDWECTYRITNAKLNIVAKVCGFKLNHHEALSDAIVCGQIYNLYKKGCLPLDAISEACPVKKNVQVKRRSHEERLKGDVFKPDFEHATNKTNPFFMKKVVVTGFPTAQKREIATELKLLGADVDTGVTKKTNFLIIGETAGPVKISKMKRNIDDGKEATILSLESYELFKKMQNAST